MAQTVAVQRGTASLTGDGATRTTLFTLSSGTATRVIVGGIAIRGSTSSTRNLRAIFCIDVNGSGNYLPVMMGGTNFQTGRYFSLFPNGASAPMGNTPAYVGTTPGQIWGSQGYQFVGDSQNGYGSSANDIKIQMAADQQAAGSSTPMNIVPAQFWMANGDSLQVIYYNYDGYAATIVYHFVTVTES